MIYTYNYTPVFEDYTKNGLLSLGAIVKIMENAGSAQTDYVGDCAFRANRTWAWVLTEWKVEVLEWPKYGEKLTTKTWSRGINSPLTSNRDYLMYDPDGELVARGTTSWIVLDLGSGRPLRLNAEIVDKYEPQAECTAFEDDTIEKITTPAQFTWEKEVQIQRRDIDINDHVHNLTYLDYAFEALPRELYRCNAFKKVRISFKKALTENDRAICKYATEETPNATARKIFIHNQDGVLCTAIELN